MGTIDRNKCAGRKALITGKVCRCGRCVGERETGWKKALVSSAGIERLIKGRLSTCRCVGLVYRDRQAGMVRFGDRNA